MKIPFRGIPTGILAASAAFCAGCGVTGGYSIINCNLESAWQQVDDFSGESGSATAQALVAGSDGAIYVSGYGSHSDGNSRWVVRKSTDQGANWQTANSYLRSSSGSSGGFSHGLAEGPDGAIYTFARAHESGANYWMVRRSTDGGASFTTVDSFLESGESETYPREIEAHSSGRAFAVGGAHFGGGNLKWLVRMSASGDADSWTEADRLGDQEASAYDVAIDDEGRTYVVGYNRTGGLDHWIVRRSVDNGASWETVDDFQLDASEGSSARGAVVALDGTVYVAGTGTSGAVKEWVIRRSASGDSGSWETVDRFQLTTGFNAQAWSLALDAAGRLWAAGPADDSSGDAHWVTRVSPDGVQWDTMDSYQAASGFDSFPNGITADGLGNVYTAGFAASGSGVSWQVRRLRCR